MTNFLFVSSRKIHVSPFHMLYIKKKKEKYGGQSARKQKKHVLHNICEILLSESQSSCVLLPGPAPFEAASPHFSWLLLPPPAVLLGCSVHPPADAVLSPVTVSDVSPPEVVPVVKKDI